MPRNVFACAAVASAVLIFSGPSTAQPATAPAAAAETANPAAQRESLSALVNTWEEKSRAAYEAGKWVSFYAANMKLKELLPYEPRYFINIVRACGQLDRRSTAYNYMLELQQQGFSYDFSSTDDTLKIRDTEAYHYINNLMIDAGRAAGEGQVAFRLAGNPADYTSITWDESRSRFLLGTRQDGKLLSLSESGDTEVLLEANSENGLQSITGLEVDADNNRLWLTSSPTPQFVAYTVADQGQGVLYELDLATLAIIGRYELPADGLKHALGSLAVSDEQHVYVIDTATPIIYRKIPGQQKLEPFFTSPEMLRFSDIAVTDEGGRIFVADEAKGILVIDPGAEKAAMLMAPENLNLGGIGGIEFFEEQLFVIQGGFVPQRIMRLSIDPSGGAATSAIPMALALSDFNTPRHGVIQGGDLVYIANTSAGPDAATIVMRTPLGAEVEIAQPTQDELNNASKPRNP